MFFDSTPEMRSELDAFVAFENECCPGSGFSVRDASGALRLEITVIDRRGSVVADAGLK